MKTATQRFTMVGAFCLIACATNLHAQENDTAGQSFDNLVPIKETKRGSAFIDPNADFSIYQQIDIQKPSVAFRKNWQREQNRSRTQNINSEDMARIKEDVASLFEQVFTERLKAAGFTIVDATGEDVLLIKPSIVDLDITAPENRSAGRSYTLTTSSAAATLYIELFDSQTGDIIGRAADRQVIRSGARNLTWNNSVTNTADGRRMFGRWADALIDFLKSNYPLQGQGRNFSPD